jgi:bifunctional non-homologous end joining protein LigD
LRELALAKLSATPPDGDAWLHEQKFDGYRILAELERGTATLWTRGGKDWTDTFRSIADAVEALPAKRATIDGEVAALLPDGRTSFQRLQGGGSELVYFAFDLLALDGKDLTALPLEARKAQLAALVRGAKGIRYSDHVVGGGAAFFQLACEKQLEGIVSKRRDSPYVGGRGGTWLKTKCIARQELVVGGWTDPSGSRTGLGALLVGYYEGKTLRYAGKVGTGYTQQMLAELVTLLAPLARRASPFEPIPKEPRVHWVEPTLVVEVAFTEWTTDGRLRHPSFQGLRRDKPASAVVRES